MLLGRKLGFDQGFDGYSELHARGKHYVSSRHLIADSIRYLDAARRPFFLFVHLFDSHFEYIEHPEHVFSDPYSGWLKSGLPYEELLRRADEFQPEDLARLLSVYDSEIAFTDEHVGQLLEALQTRGLFDDVLDHRDGRSR